MALKKGDFLTGILGSAVLKVVNGKQVAASRPVKGDTHYRHGLLFTLISLFQY